MLDEEILELRRKLDSSVKDKRNSDETYKLSIELDKLISKYYSNRLKNDKKTKEKKQENQ